MAKAKSELDVLASTARDEYGRPLDEFIPEGEKCTICGRGVLQMPVHLRNATKDGIFEQQYNQHLGCAKHANTVEYREFMREWNRNMEIAAKKKAGPGGAIKGSQEDKIQAALRRSNKIDDLMKKGMSLEAATAEVDKDLRIAQKERLNKEALAVEKTEPETQKNEVDV